MYHIMSPLEAKTPIDVLWPGWARDSRIATVVTLHDLIPLIFPEHYLSDPSCARITWLVSSWSVTPTACSLIRAHG